MALCYENKFEYNNSIRCYKKAVKYKNVDPFEKLESNLLYNYIAECYYKLGKQRKSEKFF